MTNRNLTVPTLLEDHLSAELIYQYLDNQLPAADRHLVEMHLLECNLCTDALEGLSIAPEENTRRQLFELNYHLKNRSQRRQPNSALRHLKNWALTTAIIFLLLFSAVIVWYQARQDTITPGLTTPTPVALTNASPAGGYKAYNAILAERIQYPEEARSRNIKGEVKVSFQVNTNGNLSDFKILQGLGYGCDEEAIRVIKAGPKWLPAHHNHQPVPQQQTIRVYFGSGTTPKY